MKTTRRVLIALAGLALALTSRATAQECLGITAESRGYFSYGVEGTDGAAGEAFAVGLRVRDVTLQLQKRTLKPTTFVDDLDHVQLQVAYPLTKKIPLCVINGFSWSSYDTDQVFSWSTDAEGNTTTRGTAGGLYTQLRVPVGVSLGKEFKITERFRLGTFVQNVVLYEVENGDGFDGGRTRQNTFGMGMTAGLGLSYGPLLLRSTITNTKMLDSSLSRYNDFPYMSLQLGVKF